MTRFIIAETLQDNYRRELAVIQNSHPNAKKQGLGACCNSGNCCWIRPGALSASDVARIANHLGMTEKQFFGEWLVVDEIRGHTVLVPRRKHQSGGEKIGWRETYSIASPCAFLGDDNRCTIHSVKPESCANFKCWDDAGEPILPEHDDGYLKSLGWDGYDPDDYDDCDE